MEDGSTKVILDKEKDEYPDIDQYGMKAYWTKKNLSSLDGLPGLQTAHKLGYDPKSPFSVEECAGIVKNHEQKNMSVSVIKGLTSETQNLKLLAAFTLGMLVTATYVRLSRQF